MIRFYVTRYNDKGLADAPRILSKNLRSTLNSLGRILVRNSKTRMREDLGASKRSLKIRVEGRGLNLNLKVYSTLIQAVIDALGLKAGRVFPDYSVGSKIFKWTKRNFGKKPGIGNPKRVSHLPRRKSKSKRRKNRRVSKGRVGRTRRTSGDLKVLRRAFLVARSVYEKGIKAGYWHKRTLDANTGRIKRDITNSIIRSVVEINKRGQA